MNLDPFLLSINWLYPKQKELFIIFRCTATGENKNKKRTLPKWNRCDHAGLLGEKKVSILPAMAKKFELLYRGVKTRK